MHCFVVPQLDPTTTITCFSCTCFSQYRLVAYRVILEWALKGELLGKGNRRVLPSCVVTTIRNKYPSPTGQYVGFKEAQDALRLF